MPFQHLFNKRLRHLEEDMTITNPKERYWVFLRKLLFRLSLVRERVRPQHPKTPSKRSRDSETDASQDIQ
jgi:hypothetical protein